MPISTALASLLACRYQYRYLTSLPLLALAPATWPPCTASQGPWRVGGCKVPVPGGVRHVPHRVGGVAGAGPHPRAAAPGPGLPAGAAGGLQDPSTRHRHTWHHQRTGRTGTFERVLWHIGKRAAPECGGCRKCLWGRHITCIWVGHSRSQPRGQVAKGLRAVSLTTQRSMRV